MLTYLVDHFPVKATEQQFNALRKLELFLRSDDPAACFVLKGYAGTGKTTLISALVKALPHLKMRTFLLAPTGRAAKVISNYAGKRAFTIHKKIYRKKNAATPDLHFSLADNKHIHTLFIVDEASMISNEKLFYNQASLLEDLIQYVYAGENCRLMLVGDIAQLPPVGLLESPALHIPTLQQVFNLSVYSYELTDVVRQQKDSGILFNATRIREHIRHMEADQSVDGFPKISTSGFPDTYRMTGEKLLEGLHYAYDKYGMERTLVICRSNKSANLYNQHIRNQILYREEELTGGDFIMVVKNNYHWKKNESDALDFIANGEMAVVRRVRNVHKQYGFRFADITLELLDDPQVEPMACRVLLDTLHVESPNLGLEDSKKLFAAIEADYQHIRDKRERLVAIKEDDYYNALQIKFGMAVTCHKAQGGQWDAVFLDQGYLAEEQVNAEFLRWLYTAMTRATQELYLLNFHQAFF